MRRTATLWVCVMMVASVLAQAQAPLSEKLAQLREAIKTLKWREIDVAAVDPRLRCQALLFLNHAVGEIGAADTAQADLLSDFLDQQQLGEQFVNAAPPPVSPELTFEDGVKIAIALLQGPLAQSSWVTELSGVSDDGLKAYEMSYMSMGKRKWAEVVEARQEIRRMSTFLRGVGKLQDYDKWVPVEIERRQNEHDAEMARRRSAYVAAEKADEQRAADARAARQQEENAAAAQDMDTALQVAQAAPAATTVVDDDDGWYSGWYYGALSNVRRGQWYRDGANVGQARARTDQRVNNWHAGGGRRR